MNIKSNISTLFVLMMLIIGTPACNKKVSPGSPDYEDTFYPLKKGTKWTYERNFRKNAASIEHFVESYEIIGDTIVDNQFYYLMLSRKKENYTSTFYWMVKNGFIYEQTTLIDQPRKIHKLYAREGDEWFVDEPYSGNNLLYNTKTVLEMRGDTAVIGYGDPNYVMGGWYIEEFYNDKVGFMGQKNFNYNTLGQKEEFDTFKLIDFKLGKQ